MAPAKERTEQKKKLNETKGKNAVGFLSLADNHVLYPLFFTPKSLPMMPRVLVVSRADKIVISALFASSVVRNNICMHTTLSLRHC